jgi:hypothetical protein
MSDINEGTPEVEETGTAVLDEQFKVGEYDIEVVDERDPEDQREPEAEAEPEVDLGDGEPTDEELQAVSARVKKRIDKLTFKINDERRGREAAERMQEEAIRFAKGQQEENGQLRTLMAEGENFLVSEVRNRTKSDVSRSQQEYQLALQEGDPIRIADAQMALNRSQIEQHQADSYVPQPPQQQQAPPQQPGQTQTQQAPVQQQVDVGFEQWKGRNQWFDEEPAKRAYAVALHEEIRDDPNKGGEFVGTEAYYTEIDNKMKEGFPSFFGTEGTSEPAASSAPLVVAPASRQKADAGSPRKVQLTETQVSLAKRLKIPLEVYAREHLKLGGN